MAEMLRPSDLAGNPGVHWLLDLNYAGQVWRIANAELDILDEDGNWLHYSEGLFNVDVTEAMDFLADASASPTTAVIEMLCYFDVTRLVALGHDLGSATGVLSRWVEGTVLERRRVLIRGIVSNPIYGADLEPVSFSLEANVWAGPDHVPIELPGGEGQQLGRQHDPELGA